MNQIEKAVHPVRDNRGTKEAGREQISNGVEILKKGGVIAYPTDTVYGIGCNIFDEKAVKRVFELKGRNYNQPLSVAVSNFKMLEQLAFITEKEKEILQKLLPGPFTIILPKKPVVSGLVTADSELVGLRIPDYKQVIEMINKAGFPIVTTSANLSGKEPPVRAEEVDLEVDFVVEGECKHKEPSTVIDLKDRKVIREGAGKINHLLNL